MKWKRQPQETQETYMFSGQFVVTSGVIAQLSKAEIQAIYNETRTLAAENYGLDYLQVYIHEGGEQKLFFMDQLNREMIASGDFRKEDNYCTLLLAEEY